METAGHERFGPPTKCAGWPHASTWVKRRLAPRAWSLDVAQEFKKGTSPIMIATDVAARGLGDSPSCFPPLPDRTCLHELVRHEQPADDCSVGPRSAVRAL